MPDRPAQLFKDGAFEFQMNLRRGSDAFFHPTAAHTALLAERRHWLAAYPAHYIGQEPGTADLLAETIAFARALQPDLTADSLQALGENWEPDFLLLRPDPTGVFRLVAGCVCFPSHWALEEKIGQPLTAIHAPVPTLNTSLGAKIDTFLARLRPGEIWERSNWGLAATAELNNHPTRPLPRLTATTPSDAIWLRLEHQAFRTLPTSGCLLFAIRLEIIPLLALPAETRTALTATLRTMSPEIAAYKGLTALLPRVLTTGL